LGHPEKQCKDTQVQIDRYRNKISAPLWDRIDMHIEVPALRYRDMIQQSKGEPSALIRERVTAARQIQRKRFGNDRPNGQLSSSELKKHAVLGPECQDLLRHAVDEMGMSARACDRLVRVARTIADLAGSKDIQRDHLMEAITFRNLNVEKR
jgi:magnesium chelatase family protein